MLEEEDKELARLLQVGGIHCFLLWRALHRSVLNCLSKEKEKQRIEKRERERRDLESHTPRKETTQVSCDWKSQVPKKSSWVSV